MSDEPQGQNEHPEAAQASVRSRTYLKGVIYYDNRRASIDCTIRDLSDTGARIAFATVVTVPDIVELHIPQKQVTLPAHVRRRDQLEIGISFDDRRSDEPRRSADGELAERVVKIENELITVKRLLKKMEAKVLLNESET
jgi:hypothetical protein